MPRRKRSTLLSGLTTGWARRSSNWTSFSSRYDDAPYPDAASRRPVLQWLREIQMDGEPADVAATVRRYGDWLASSATTPKLLLTFDAPSVLGSPAVNAWAREHIAALEVVALGRAGHHAPEDVPTEIGQAIAGWLRERAAAAGRRGLAIDAARDAQMRVCIDSFAVPGGVRAAFDRQLAEVLAFLRRSMATADTSSSRSATGRYPRR